MVEPLKKASFLYDEKGARTHVLLPVSQYEKLLEVIEDAGLLRAMQEADGDDVLSVGQALAALEE